MAVPPEHRTPRPLFDSGCQRLGWFCLGCTISTTEASSAPGARNPIPQAAHHPENQPINAPLDISEAQVSVSPLAASVPECVAPPAGHPRHATRSKSQTWGIARSIYKITNKACPGSTTLATVITILPCQLVVTAIRSRVLTITF